MPERVAEMFAVPVLQAVRINLRLNVFHFELLAYSNDLRQTSIGLDASCHFRDSL